MEITAGDDGIVRENQRIVGDRIGLDFKGAGNRAQQIEAGAVDLRLAADAIGILHALVALDVALANDGVFQQRAKRGCRVDLALMATQCVNIRMEGRRRAHGGIGGHGAGDKGCLCGTMGAKQA